MKRSGIGLDPRSELPQLPSRFELLARLGAGGMGVVYSAFDRDTAAEVALKVMKRISADALLRLKDEFRVLQDLHHPNLVRYGELIEHQGQWFFTMELVDGQDLLSWVRPGTVAEDHAPGEPTTVADSRPARLDRLPALTPETIVTAGAAANKRNTMQLGGRLDETRLRAALPQIVSGLSYLHAAGKIHRDVKPSNILVTPQERVVLLDFGVAADVHAGQPGDADREVVGTPAFMAPEQARGEGLHPAVDWYSLGVVMFLALTGQYPPAPGALGALGHELPADLARMCEALLVPDPKARADEDALRDMLGDSGGRAAVRSVASDAVFVGRQAESSLLARAFDAARQTAVTVCVRGDSGVGKTTLVRQFVDSVAADMHATILTGRCYERESVPYKGIDGAIDGLGGILRGLSAEELERVVPPHAEHLAELFPTLGRVRGLPSAADGDRTLTTVERRNRGFDALRELLRNLAAQRPVVIVLDDLHWAEHDTFELLRTVLAPPNAPQVLVVATARNLLATEDEAMASAYAQHLSSWDGDVRWLELGPLPADDSRELARALLAEAGAVDEDRAVASVANEASGHPLFIAELCRFAATSTTAATQGLRLGDALAARLAKVPPVARRLLETLAVAGAPLPRHVAAVAADLEPAQLDPHVDLLRAANLIRTTGNRRTDVVEPYHDQIRATVVSSLEASELMLHRSLAIALEGAERIDAELLATHWSRAGEPQRASRHAARGAEEAAEVLAFARAARLYRWSLDLSPPQGPEALARWNRLGDVLVAAGHAREAAEAYLECAHRAGDQALPFLRTAAEQFLLSGHIEEGMEALQAVLAAIGEKLPASPGRALLPLLWKRLRITLHRKQFALRSEAELRPDDLLRLDTFRAVGNRLVLVDTVRGAELQARALLLAMKLGEPQRLSIGLSMQGVYGAVQGPSKRKRSLDFVRLASEVGDPLGDPTTTAYAIAARACVEYFCGDFAGAIDRFAEAEAVMAPVPGRSWEIDTARLMRLFALRNYGDLGQLYDIVKDSMRDGERRGDRYLQTTLARGFNIAWLARDRPDAASRVLENSTWAPLDAVGFHLQHYYEARARAEIALYLGAGAEALPTLGADFERAAKALFSFVQTVLNEGRWTHARLLIAAARTSEDDETIRQHLKAASRLAKQLRRGGVAYARVWADLVDAAIAHRRGDDERARRHLQSAIEGASVPPVLLCAAAAERRLGLLIGDDTARAWQQRSDQTMTELGVLDPARMTEVIAPGF